MVYIPPKDSPEVIRTLMCPPVLPTTPYCTEYPVISPLRWMQSTAPHWIVILEEVTVDTLTEVGAADGAGGEVCTGHKVSQT